ncbi:hypothetical protein Sant_P0139 (plasmid) [Sodalis praecaptivus]|uniref:Uncharacterized protein n=1 Tax=Sodalis praecaptivus TaxID=1239307 RepID=W0I3Y8_9GAMM|nr:hypothetical protein [Sodalis praecaptivus]AHF79185.1 hypothetical protein Sant_P0139 [Sodalis praecaptivus]
MSPVPAIAKDLSAAHLQRIDPDNSPDDARLVRSLIAATAPPAKAPPSVPRLVTLAAARYLQPAFRPFDLRQYRRLCLQAPPMCWRQLRRVAGETLRTIPLWGYVGMAKVIADERVIQGESCHNVGQILGALTPQAKEALEMVSVEGPAGQRVKQGESCLKVSDTFGITTYTAINVLETLSMEGPAGERVKRGEHCQKVADAFGITHWKVKNELELKAVEGPAGQRVRQGESCRTVAAEFGMLEYLANEELELIAVSGLAGERVKNGESCETVAQAHGIEFYWPRRELELIAVDGPAGQSLRRGASIESVVERFGLVDEDALAILGEIALENAADKQLSSDEEDK